MLTNLAHVEALVTVDQGVWSETKLGGYELMVYGFRLSF